MAADLLVRMRERRADQLDLVARELAGQARARERELERGGVGRRGEPMAAAAVAAISADRRVIMTSTFVELVSMRGT